MKTCPICQKELTAHADMVLPTEYICPTKDPNSVYSHYYEVDDKIPYSTWFLFPFKIEHENNISTVFMSKEKNSSKWIELYQTNLIPVTDLDKLKDKLKLLLVFS